MFPLLTSDAVILVRKNLDEIDPNGSIMYFPTNSENKDNTSLDDIIIRNLPEAVNAVHLAAPATVLVGKEVHDYENGFTIDSEGVIDFEISTIENDIPLRLVQFKAVDSDIVVTDVLAEASPEGRKQLNRYIRGRFDRPRLVRQQSSPYKYKYYSVTDAKVAEYETEGDDPSLYIETCTYLPVAAYNATSVDIDSTRIKQNVIDCLTAMTLETYSQPDKAKVFYDRAAIYH